jgi:hypothetical protein
MRLIDGTRTVRQIGAELASRGIKEDVFRRAWQATFAAMERVNRVLLAPPPSAG